MRTPALAPVGRPSIDALIARYLAEGVPTRSRKRVGMSLDLLRHGLDGYGYQHLTKADRALWSAAFEDGDEEAFCRLFGARYVAKYLGEFLGYFLIRKVMLSEEDVAATVEDVRGFVAWLAAIGELTPTAARKALGSLASASVDLPAAERLGRLLYAITSRNREIFSAAAPAFDEVVDDFLVIQRVAPGRLWFLDDIGPIKVPEAASAVARPGWTVNLVLGRRGSSWDVLEVGNVYPETLA